MPRPKKESGPEPKKRSRTGCWPCKSRKVKCGEEKPACNNCIRGGEECDYSIRLNWGGRSRKDKDGTPVEGGAFTFVSSPGGGLTSGAGHEHIFSSQHLATAPPPRPSSTKSTGSPSTPELTPTGSFRAHTTSGLQGELPPPSHLPPFYTRPALPSSHMHSLYQTSANDRSPPTSIPMGEESHRSSQHNVKRVKLELDENPPDSRPCPPLFAVPHYATNTEGSPASSQFTTHTITSIATTPATPNSINSSSPYSAYATGLNAQDAPDLRRLSVKSLLSDPSEETDKSRSRGLRSIYRTYGYDHGIADLDVPHNDDTAVVLPKSPDLRRASAAVSEVSSSSGEADARLIAFEPGGYYAQPVPVRIPLALEPLPQELLNNQMNLLYFHHFINHTGRILVPHDCPENPFRGVLPMMAVRNTQLLRLVLAFSASHRARLLDHPEPANRIAEWMSEVFPALRRALAEPQSPGANDPADPSSLAPLATAIMLASLEIVSPSTLAVSISWQDHLQVATEMIIAKGGLHHLAQKANGARDKAIFFLSRWFAYMDVLGSLSRGGLNQPMFGAYLENGGGLWLVNRSDDEVGQIDCFFGFSGRCISLLAQVAELSGECDRQRIDPVTNQIKVGWSPTESVRQQAVELQERLIASATADYSGCSHASPESGIMEMQRGQDVEEIYATNESYHWAGLIHLSRRVLNLPSDHPDVQASVSRILSALKKVRHGSTAESCLLFPMFSAGCEAQTEEARGIFMERLRHVERWGMSHVARARILMQATWDTGRPWELMVKGEFLG